MFEQAFKNIDDVLWKEAGCTTELDYAGQSSWLLFLKYLDDLEQDKSAEAALESKKYTYILDKLFRWESWAAPKDKDGKLDHNKALTGDDLRDFVNGKLFPYLHSFKQKASGPNTIEFMNDMADMTENQNFYILQHGIRWTAMPGWKNALTEQQIWQLVTFLSQMHELPPAAKQVFSETDKGVVTLSGTVTSENDKSQAESIAKSIASTQVVADQIAVIPVGVEKEAKTVNSDLDAGIEKNLDPALIQNKIHDTVKYNVKNGVVTLTGEVNSQQKREHAEKVATRVPNVKQVVNDLQVKNQKASSSQ